MKRAYLHCVVLAAAPLPAFAQGTASAPLSGKPSTKAHGDYRANLIGTLDGASEPGQGSTFTLRLLLQEKS